MKRVFILFIATLLVCAACDRGAQTRGIPVWPVAFTDETDASTTETPQVPSVRVNVKTDYTYLTPNFSQGASNSRLSEGPMPRLVASNDYGALLPYVGAIAVMQYGGLRTTKYGLMTTKGVLVTDAVYDTIERARYYTLGLNKDADAYLLAISKRKSEDDPWYANNRYAVCSTDGSWITPLEYVNAVFSDKVFCLQRDFQTADIEVYDYSGKLLYNIKDKDWAANFDFDIFYNWIDTCDSEGYAHPPTKDGKIAFIHLQSGTCHITEFDLAQSFNESYAPVGIINKETGQSLWGYIDTDFNIAIEPIYDYANLFINGYAAVDLSDGSQLIDKNGNVILSVRYGGISQNIDCYSIVVNDYDTYENDYYTSDFKKMSISTESGKCTYAYYIGDGWYYGDCYAFAQDSDNEYATTDQRIGIILFSEKGSYFFDDITYISQIAGEYIIYSTYDSEEYLTGIRALDGREIIPFETDVNITAIQHGDSVSAFMINTSEFIYREKPVSPSYKLINTDGTIITSGAGTLAYDDTAELYSLLTVDSYSILDKNCKTIIDIPLLSYMLD